MRKTLRQIGNELFPRQMFGMLVMVVTVGLAACTSGPAPDASQDLSALAAPARVLILGSSTTACAGQLTVPDDCYVKRVRAALPDSEVTAIGRGGTYVGFYNPKDKRPAAEQNWTKVAIPSGYDRVVIQLGINDWYVPVAPATYRTQLNGLISRVRTANPGAQIAWLRTWNPTTTTATQMQYWALHGQVTADAMQFDGGTFIDMGTSPQLRRSNVPADNGWHYNSRGHAELAAAVLRWMETN